MDVEIIQYEVLAKDPLRLQLAELLTPGATDDDAIITRIRYLLTCEKALTCWREKGLPF